MATDYPVQVPDNHHLRYPHRGIPFDEDSIIKNIELEYQISDLKEEIAKYEQRYQKDSEELKELQRDPNEISRIARERYFMKKDDEDIFVLSTDEKTSDNSIDNETVE